MYYTRLRYSKDGGHNRSNWRQKPLGVTGSFGKRTKFWQFGQALNFVFEETVTDNCRADIIAASIQVNGSGKWTPVPIGGGAYKDDVLPWASQDVVNRVFVPAERGGTRSDGILRDLPGCAVFGQLTGHIRGMHVAEGLLLVVAGSTLYRISTAGVATSIGTIPGVGRVKFAHNQVGEGNEVVVGNGQSGYVYNTQTAVFSQITDPAFPGFKSLDFVDGYIAGVEPQGRYWFISDLAGALSYNSLDRQDAETQPDKIVGLIVSHREVLVLGTRTGQFFRNTGAGTGTFKNANGAEMDVGAASQHAITRLDNSVFWVGNDGVGYRLENGIPVRKTTHAIEQAWSRCNLSQAYAFAYDDNGHKIWYVTMTDGQTWGFDVASGEWHRRKSYGLDFWRMADLVRWNGAWVGGDYSDGSLYQLSWQLSNDAGEPLERSRTFGVLHDHQNPVSLDAVEIVYNTGMTPDSPPLPQLIVSGVQIAGDLGNGVTGEVVSYQYTVTGGVPPNVVTLASGALPAGLSMNSSGLITGTRTTVGVYTWGVLVTDALGNTDSLLDESVTLAAECVDIRDPTQDPVYYLLVDGDDTDETYAEDDYDYSAWDTGLARFDSNAGAAVTLIPQEMRLWVRHEIVLSSTTGLQFQYNVDDRIQLWINGVMLFEATPGGAVTTYDVDPADLQEGCNHVAISAVDTGGGRAYLTWQFLQ